MKQEYDDQHSSSGIILYQTEDGQTRLEVRLDGKTAWLSQILMAKLIIYPRNQHFAEKNGRFYYERAV